MPRKSAPGADKPRYIDLKYTIAKELWNVFTRSYYRVF